MGNHLAATAPSQILSVESYLADVNEYKFDKNLGSTRFMKVARAKSQEGHAVVKVFVIHDASIDLDSYASEIETIKGKLKQASNCIPFQSTVVTERAAFLTRQYAKHNLYDRISTRPFYNNIERRWVAFQLLCALNQMAKFHIWHGDIKSENVLITSWNWLLLTDFASYKPLYLPDDNPADFNYFFDTSRRRTCYIAPERFTDQLAMLASNRKQLSERDSKSSHAMDIFSAGCVIAEVFTDGTPLFDLAQLLSYREHKFYPDAALSKIEDPHIQSLVKHMIQLNPADRYTAEQYLTLWKSKAFPDHFYSYLKYYLGRFCEPPLMSADQCVSALHTDKEKILHNLVYHEETTESLVLITALLLSCTRSLKYVNCKLKALHLITEFAKHLKPDVILERLVPYLAEFVKDSVPRVKAHAVKAMATCLTFVSEVPKGEANVFSEYVLPTLAPCAKDTSVLVRQAFAENFAIFAEAALRFLDSSQASFGSAYIAAIGGDPASYDSQLQLLRVMIQNRVQILLTDTDSTVKQSLLQFSVARLSAFFGKQKANDLLLSHMITFLNDKQDWLLRASFFTSLVSVVAYIGWQSSHILRPLLQQGLSDKQEFVVSQTLTAMSSLVDLGLVQKQLVCELLKDNALFLAHPCKWIRQNSVSFICSCARILDPIDMHCYVLPVLSQFLRFPVLQAEKERIVLNALKPSVKYAVYDLVYNAPNTKAVLSAIRSRQQQHKSQSMEGSILIEDKTKADEKTNAVLRKLALKDMSVNDEAMLLHFEQYINKQQKNGSMNSISPNIEWQNDSDLPDDGVIDIQSLGNQLVRRHADMVSESDVVGGNKYGNKKAAARKKNTQGQPHDMNDEWKTMFGSDASKVHSSLAFSTKKGSSSNLAISMSQLESSAKPIVYSAPETKSTYVQLKYASCKLDLRALVHHRRDLYKDDVLQKELEEQADNNNLFPVTDWQPKGHLVAHMKEHKGPIHKLAVSPSNHHFVTVSSDRSIRLWEAIKMEGKAVVNRSKALCTNFTGPLRCATFCDDDMVVCASDDGCVSALSVELMAAKSVAEKPESMPTPSSPILYTYSINAASHGRITDLRSVVTSPLIIFTTSHGIINALDLRTKKTVWELKHDLTHGVPTSFCIDPKQHWLCVGTSHGMHVCWDLRFLLSITKFSHPSLAGVRYISTHPTQASCVVSVATGNNEVSIWDIETGSRQLTLWGSTAPPLSLSKKSEDSVNGLCSSITNDGIRFFTGGTDGKIRLWDVNNAERSQVISGPELGSSRNHHMTSYKTLMIDGTHVILEQREDSEASDLSAPEQAEDRPGNNNRWRFGEHSVPSHHYDVITDIGMFHVNQRFLVTTARDGVVKIWK